MKATTKQILIGTSWWLVFLAMIGGVMLWQHQVRKAKPVTNITVTSTERIPTLLLLDHQLTNDQNRQLIANLQYNSGSQAMITLEVQANGQTTIKGQLAATDNRPYLQLILPTTVTQPAEQAKLVKQAIIGAQKTLNFKHFNLISYGNGGLAATNYVEKATKALTPQHLILIATPFNGTSHQRNQQKMTPVATNQRTSDLTKLIAGRTAIDSKLKVLIIAGKTKHTADADQVLPLQSALAGQMIFKSVVQTYQQKVIPTWHTEHAHIMTSWRVSNVIHKFIN
ncbi:alpha/beta hydrolase [Lactiplantibacillus herbarum]|uniref:alpha/beta hydrolase n=1 Tax=Lactiplantibacillus herbarum TaxID=1670446 RepID=UPI00064EA69F|nr:alpha/beta hydrolase [Lactiplantibacillus herbarum]